MNSTRNRCCGNRRRWRVQTNCQMNGKPTIMLSANNYLNLTTHPRVVAAMQEATTTYGAGSGSVRAIAGTMDIHLEAMKKKRWLNSRVLKPPSSTPQATP